MVLKKHHIPYSVFNEIVGYAPNYIIQGFNVLDEEKSEKVIKHFGLESEIHLPPINEEEFEKAIKTILERPLDIDSKGKTRTEQTFLRNYLFKNKKRGTCGICGKEFPVTFLVASHIKKRSLCTNEERLDYKNIVMPMCKFGCDDLYEKGYITISNGKVETIKQDNLTKTIINYIEDVKGNDCIYWDDNSKKYFEWHKSYHKK